MKRVYILMFSLLAATVATAQDVLTILHTNDTHSCVEPEKNGGAGALNRALLLDQLRDSLGRRVCCCSIAVTFRKVRSTTIPSRAIPR